jgi:membrane peptidoglycan carboxypeptidase
MTKDEILSVYLNTVYFGSGAYGVKAAAEVYFGIDTTNKTDAEVVEVLDEGLGWGEAALLASLISNPNANDPILNPQTADYQRGIVLERLAELGFITPEDVADYSSRPLPNVRYEPTLPSENDFFIAEVRKLLLEDERYLGGGVESRLETLLGGGLRIHTTFDPRVQDMAENARNTVLRGEDPQNPRVPYDFTMAIASVDVQSGAVRAMVGGESFDQDSQFNIATQGLRQPGSQGADADQEDRGISESSLAVRPEPLEAGLPRVSIRFTHGSVHSRSVHSRIRRCAAPRGATSRRTCR